MSGKQPWRPADWKRGEGWCSAVNGGCSLLGEEREYGASAMLAARVELEREVLEAWEHLVICDRCTQGVGNCYDIKVQEWPCRTRLKAAIAALKEGME